MSYLSKSRATLLLVENETIETLEQLKTQINTSITPFFKCFKIPNTKITGIFSFTYRPGENNEFSKTITEFVKKLENKGSKILLLRYYEQDSFLKSNWVSGITSKQLLQYTKWPKSLKHKFFFIQISFITKAWYELIKNTLQEFSRNEEYLIPQDKWDNYMIGLLFVIPPEKELTDTLEVINKFILRLIDESKHYEPVKPKKPSPEVLYQDFATTLLSSMIHSTTQGLYLSADKLQTISFHMEGVEVILRPLEEEQGSIKD